MMNLYTSIIDPSFLENHFTNKPKVESDYKQNDKQYTWFSINSFLIEKTGIVIINQNINRQTLPYQNPILFDLLNSYWESKRKDISLVDKCPSSKEIRKTALLSSFFFIDEHILSYNPLEYGFVMYNSKNIISKWINKDDLATEYLITGEDLVSNQLRNWDDFCDFCFAGQNLIINDNYIFRYKESIKNNFVKLVKALYPIKSKSISLNILVITRDVYEKSLKKEESLDVIYEVVYNSLLSELEELPFKLTIVKKDSNDYHDRHIITDYLMIKSSNSISFFNENGQVVSPSTVTIEPKAHIAKNGLETTGHNTIHFLKAIKLIVNTASELNIFGERNFPMLNNVS